jgi:hypothetical protein
MEAKIYAAEHRARLLAACIPALSLAAGKAAIDAITLDGGGNFDMQALYRSGWPSQRINPNDILSDRWLHNDLREVAYYFVYPLFRRMVQTGGLQ